MTDRTKTAALAGLLIILIGVQIYGVRTSRDANFRALTMLEAARTYQRLAAYFGQKALRCEKMYYDLIRS
jgi:hypothetical protein